MATMLHRDRSDITTCAKSNPIRYHYSLNDGIDSLNDDIESSWTLNSPG